MEIHYKGPDNIDIKLKNIIETFKNKSTQSNDTSTTKTEKASDSIKQIFYIIVLPTVILIIGFIILGMLSDYLTPLQNQLALIFLAAVVYAVYFKFKKIYR